MLVTLLVAMMATPSAGQEAPDFVATSGPLPAEHDPSRPAWPIEARLTGPTDRYAHGVLGNIPMFSRLEVRALACGTCGDGREGDSIELPEALVFEDVAPRLWDVTGDGSPEIVVVEAHRRKGARLAVWAYPEKGRRNGALQRIGATPFIGAPQRWLAPAGIGDFDGDGRTEIAFVDRPHLARELVFVRMAGERLVQIARVPGFSSHRIGDTTIRSGVRNCGLGDELILPDADHSRLIAYRLDKGATDLGAFSVAALTACGGARASTRPSAMSDADYLLNPEVKYSLTDSIWLAMGGTVFGGDSSYTQFRQFAENDNIYTQLRYEF